MKRTGWRPKDNCATATKRNLSPRPQAQRAFDGRRCRWEKQAVIHAAATAMMVAHDSAGFASGLEERSRATATQCALALSMFLDRFSSRRRASLIGMY